MADTIFAVATPPGHGGIGIVRVSGSLVQKIATALLGSVPPPRCAELNDFRNEQGELLDTGIALYYPAPASYTGEDVLELQGHGSPAAQQRIAGCLTRLEARIANPGEFTERAFLNDKLDLAQAEAVADLIASSSEQAARAATRSLSGEFSEIVHRLDQSVLTVRMFVESAIDFAEEEIDFLSDGEQHQRLKAIMNEIDATISRLSAGMAMQVGLEVTIAGDPNVGKSSLLNALLGEDRAIVTPTAGTTRDTLHGEFVLDGLPIRLTDTAGLRASDDQIENIGMQRAQVAISEADLVLWVVDETREMKTPTFLDNGSTLVVRNKCDLTGLPPGELEDGHYRISALTREGLESLCGGIKALTGYLPEKDALAGRPRHLDALRRTQEALRVALDELMSQQGELVAENLRLAHDHLGEIVGKTTTDDLLGEIFSTFCIGK